MLQKFIAKMEAQQLPKAAIDTFIYYYNQLSSGKTGFIPENELEPVTDSEIVSYNDISQSAFDGQKVLENTILIKLNGGLGTTMGLQGPKALIPVKNGLNFLDITALQIITCNKQYGSKIPLLLMNSFKTDAPSAEILKKYPQLNSDFPQSFLQHMFPRIEASTLEPVENPVNPQLEWNPPGHGDIYTAFATSGILDQLLKKGYLYAFVSNIDNLGATLNKNILGYFAKNKISFLMEVTNRTWMDRKGGHIAKRKNGKFVLREASQCPPTDSSFFKDISRHSFFNTNNLWINLQDLKDLLDKKNNVLDLPMIRNRKKLDPLDENSADVFQLESAMGTAISIFDNATALYVPRSRFAPVKSCEELLLLWSDYFVLNDNFEIIHNQNRKSQQVNINLDPQFYSRIDQLEERFPNSAPSLLDCDSFKISGDVKFGKNITIKNSVEITNNKNIQAKIADNSFIDNDILFE